MHYRKRGPLEVNYYLYDNLDLHDSNPYFCAGNSTSRGLSLTKQFGAASDD